MSRSIRTEHHVTRDIDAHVALIQRQVERSLRDPETRQLAVKIVSGSFVWRKNPRTGSDEPHITAWGKTLYAPGGDVCQPKDAECELIKVWNFVLKNFRYVYDPDQIDTFTTVKYSLEAGGGDCDDATILFGSLLRAIGFQVRARVIATTDAPSEWVHIYPLVGLPKDNPSKWVPLDMTMKDYLPGDEYPQIAAYRDYQL